MQQLRAAVAGCRDCCIQAGSCAQVGAGSWVLDEHPYFDAAAPTETGRAMMMLLGIMKSVCLLMKCTFTVMELVYCLTCWSTCNNGTKPGPHH